MKLSDKYAIVRRRRYMRKYMRAYYTNNPDQRQAQRERVKAHRAKPENRQKHIDYMREYHAQKKQARINSLSQTEIADHDTA